MRDFRRPILALAVVAAWCVPARAAEDGKKTRPVPEAGAVQVILLRHKSVRDDLKLTDAETRTIHDFTDKQWKKAQHAETLGTEESERAFADMSKENERFLDQILEPDQRKRLNQITLQTAGLLWVTRPDVASDLKLTDEQKAKAAASQKDARTEMEDLLHSASPGDRQAKLRELRSTSRKRLMDILTDDQESKWKEMSGAPFRGDLRFDEDEPKK